jgi:hypothetical protein
VNPYFIRKIMSGKRRKLKFAPLPATAFYKTKLLVLAEAHGKKTAVQYTILSPIMYLDVPTQISHSVPNPKMCGICGGHVYQLNYVRFVLLIKLCITITVHFLVGIQCNVIK